MGVGLGVGFVGEAVGEDRGRGVELVHGGETEDALYGVDDAGLVVEGADDLVAFGPGADDEQDGAMAIDVVPAVLRVVFVDEHGGGGPELAAADGLDDAAEGEVVVGEHGAGGGVILRDAVGVVVGEMERDEVGHRALLLVFMERGDEVIGADLIGDVEVPGRLVPWRTAASAPASTYS